MQITIRRIALGMGVVVAAAGCAGQRATTDYSPATRFTQSRTFALVRPPDTGAQQLLDQRVRNAVQAQLTTKGLTLADRQDADLYVGYGMVDKTHRQVYSYNDGWGWGGGRFGYRYWRWGVGGAVAGPRRTPAHTHRARGGDS